MSPPGTWTTRTRSGSTISSSNSCETWRSPWSLSHTIARSQRVPTARLGCAYCYAAFEPSLRELLRRVHGNSKHQGKRYQPPQARTEEGATVLAELRARLRRAVEQEQFEEAARLRDQIKVME